MVSRAEPIQDSLSPESAENLELRADFQRMLACSEQKEAQLSSELKAVRRDFAEFIEQYRLYEIVKVERRPGEVSLTLANLWRLTRYESPPAHWPESFDPAAPALAVFDLVQGSWLEQNPAEITWRQYVNPWRGGGPFIPDLFLQTAWPDLHCFYWRRGNPNLYVTLLASLAEKVLAALELQKKPVEDIREFGAFLFRRFRFMPYKLPVQFIEAALNRHILDRELLSLLAPLHAHSGGAAFISQYLAALPQRADLARISRESPGFRPALNLIPPEFWSRSDLLADKVLRNSSPAFQGVPAGALRWLRKAPAETLGLVHWCFKNRPDSTPKLIEVLAGLKPPAPLPLEIQWVIFPKICYLVDYLAAFWADNAVLIKRLAGLLTRQMWAAWAGSDRSPAAFKALRESTRGLPEFLDWYRAEGPERGLPDKNSTWLSLKRRSDQWHREIWQRKASKKENVAWESLLGETVMDGLRITPLVTGLDLYSEGREMRHCVTSYTRLCQKSGYRVFSLEEADGTRSTLSLIPHGKGYDIEQHKGRANGPVSPAAARAAREVCRLYNQKNWEVKERAVRSVERLLAKEPSQYFRPLEGEAMPWRAIPLQGCFLGEPQKSLDLRADFQDFWSLEESSRRLGRPLRQAFENLVERHRLYELIKAEEQPGAVRLTLANMWRLSRPEGAGLLWHTFDLAEGRWREEGAITWRGRGDGLTRPNSAESIWPDFRETRYRREEAGPGLFKNIMAAWLEKVRPALRGEVKPSLAPGEEEWFAHLFFRWSVNLPADHRSRVIDSALNDHLWRGEGLPLVPGRPDFMAALGPAP